MHSIRTRFRRLCVVLAVSIFTEFAGISSGGTLAVWAQNSALDLKVTPPKTQNPPAKKWAVILVGLAGDDDHRIMFNKTVSVWRKWLKESLQLPDEQVIVLDASDAPVGEVDQQNLESVTDPKKSTISRESIRETFLNLKSQVTERDSFWLFTLGHGNHDGKRGWFHVPGPDPSDEELGRWLSEIYCQEQVLWLTHSGSGWFIKALSRPHRIVITATSADDEFNETEFPDALATVSQMPLQPLDLSADGRISVAELFVAITKEVANRFKSDNRVPTEQAILDDNGDGVGTDGKVIEATISVQAELELDLKEVSPDVNETSTQNNSKVDGEWARKLIIQEVLSTSPRSTPPSAEKSP